MDVSVVVSSRRFVQQAVLVTAAAVLVALQLQMLPGAAAPAKSNCTTRCGDIDLEYPFGIEPSCYHPGFNLTCDHSYHPPRLLLGDGTVQVLEISIPNATVRINSSVINLNGDDRIQNVSWWGKGLSSSGPYFLSEFKSLLALVGCNVQVDVLLPAGADQDKDQGNDTLVGSCTAICPPSITDEGEPATIGGAGDGVCSGIGCCQTNIPLGYSSYLIQKKELAGVQIGNSFVLVVDQGLNYSLDMLVDKPPGGLPALLDWVISNSTSMCPRNASSAPECRSAHSSCQDSEAYAHKGYRCECSDGYQGNPYIIDGCYDIDECRSPEIYPCYGSCKNKPGGYDCDCPEGFKGNATLLKGCEDIDECVDPTAYSCYGTCINIPGSFHCRCENGTYGDPFRKGGCIQSKNSLTGSTIALIVCSGSIVLLLVLASPLVTREIKKHKEKKLKEKFFKQNHGLLLQQLISKNTDFADRMIITLEELQKATNNFDRTRQVGDGGHGVVFKGIIDLHVVAIKKSKIVVQREISEFINEVAILSQVNHRNVVKLLGCCLETEVPLLVYEFISNGTLYHHLHVEGPISISWDDRLRIALEVARALSYLHSASSMPIYHRDIKSSNILLDNSLTAKVSDFGASKYTPIDRSEITTAVQGTIGYLDPMYYYTGRLTDKSDVFSFGVLLVELLTRKKPIADTFDNGDSLISRFVTLLSKGNLVDILDPQVRKEKGGEVLEVAALAANCTKLKGDERPSMREVEMTLENIVSKGGHFRKENATSSRPDEHEISALHMPIGVTTEASRQYSMELEMLSSSFPR